MGGRGTTSCVTAPTILKRAMAFSGSASTIEALLARYDRRPESLIPALQEIQDSFGYISEASLRALSRALRISENEIYGVATFYTRFRFSPPAEHTIHVCQGTACHVRGGAQILLEFEKELGVKVGEATADGKFDLERVACVGCCALGPVGLVDGQVNSRLTPRDVRLLLEKHRGGRGGRGVRKGASPTCPR